MKSFYEMIDGLSKDDLHISRDGEQLITLESMMQNEELLISFFSEGLGAKLKSLTLGYWLEEVSNWISFQKEIEVIKNQGELENLKSLDVGFYDQKSNQGARYQEVDIGDISGIENIAPNLENLDIDGTIEVSIPLKFNKLKSICILNEDISVASLKNILISQLPDLTTLEIGFEVNTLSEHDKKEIISAFSIFLSSFNRKKLDTFHLSGIPLGDEFGELLLQSKIFMSLNNKSVEDMGFSPEVHERISHES